MTKSMKSILILIVSVCMTFAGRAHTGLSAKPLDQRKGETGNHIELSPPKTLYKDTSTPIYLALGGAIYPTSKKMSYEDAAGWCGKAKGGANATLVTLATYSYFIQQFGDKFFAKFFSINPQLKNQKTVWMNRMRFQGGKVDCPLLNMASKVPGTFARKCKPDAPSTTQKELYGLCYGGDNPKRSEPWKDDAGMRKLPKGPADSRSKKDNTTSASSSSSS